MRQNDGPAPSPDTAATSRSQTTPHHGPLPRNRSGTDTAQAPCGYFSGLRVAVSQTIFLKSMAAAMNQFSRVVAGEIRNCCRIQINADVIERRGLALEDGAIAQL